MSARGFAALQLSVWGAWKLFGEAAGYVVCVNSVPIAAAQARTGALPPGVEWRDAQHALPAFLRPVLGEDMAEGVAWKLAPARCFPDRWEISLDNDCILWEVPPSLADWLGEDPAAAPCLMAQDVRRCYGQFDAACPPVALNAGIRGLPPGFDLESALREAMARRQRATGAPLRFTSELDEQGLQACALSLAAPLRAVPLQEVTVCSPFHPHLPELGRCGAHFVGLNARHIPWDYYDRPADAWMAEHWARHLPQLRARTGAPVLACA